MEQATGVDTRRAVDVEAEPVDDSDDAVLHCLSVRRHHMAGNVSLSYSSSLHGPLLLRRASGCSLFDHRDRRYLDCVNNVAHVGHCHPRLVQAATQQMQRINTNTRYLSDAVSAFIPTLLSTLPSSLSVVYLLNSGSEANDLALRLARAFTGRQHVIALSGGYHGSTALTVDCSPYKFQQQARRRQTPQHVSVAQAPDMYRWRMRRGRGGGETAAQRGEEAKDEAMEQEASSWYAADVRRCIDALPASDGLCCFLHESSLSCAGQLLLPAAYLPLCYAAVRQAGGLCIADEVQCGYGRNGHSFWEFSRHGVEPDIVTAGKPMGGGIAPLAAVITRPDVAAALTSTGLEFFNTQGGSNVAAAVGLQVIRVMQEEQLISAARAVGSYCLQQLRSLQSRFSLIGDVRGIGLFIGIELVTDRSALSPATRETRWLLDRLRCLPCVSPAGVAYSGLLLSSDGPQQSVIKIKPPLTFSMDDVDVMCQALDTALSECEAWRRQQPHHQQRQQQRSLL